MSDNIEITVNNPLNILDQNEENKENEELTNLNLLANYLMIQMMNHQNHI